MLNKITYRQSKHSQTIVVLLDGKVVGRIVAVNPLLAGTVRGYRYRPSQSLSYGDTFPTVDAVKRSIES